MKELNKTNIIILWILTIALIVFITISRGWENPSTKISDLGMLAGVTLVTIIFLTRVSAVTKACCLTLIIAVDCLVVSIAQGGNDATFLVSFLPMGTALLYFNRKIITIFLSVYIPIAVIVCIVNPEYISGPGSSLTLSLEYIMIYIMLGILMILVTKRGGTLIHSSNKMLSRIKEDAKTTSSVIEQLNSSMEESSQNIGILTDRIQGISDATYEMETLTKAMSSSANALSSLVSDTVNAINQNVVLNKELEKQFEEVGIAVQNGSDGALHVKTTLDSMKDTVLASGEATEVLLGKISSVNSILKEINKITMRTNMLSINASIEAAKAGANGKGFSVVANEIKSLADESSESAKGIQQIITELSLQVDDVATKTSAGTKSAIAGLESMENLLVTLEEIKNANDIVANVVLKETQTNDEVNRKFETVSTEISNLVTDVISISETIESVSADIHKQNTSIKNVNEEIGKMKAVTASLNRTEEY